MLKTCFDVRFFLRSVGWPFFGGDNNGANLLWLCDGLRDSAT